LLQATENIDMHKAIGRVLHNIDNAEGASIRRHDKKDEWMDDCRDRKTASRMMKGTHVTSETPAMIRHRLRHDLAPASTHILTPRAERERQRGNDIPGSACGSSSTACARPFPFSPPCSWSPSRRVCGMGTPNAATHHSEKSTKPAKKSHAFRPPSRRLCESSPRRLCARRPGRVLHVVRHAHSRARDGRRARGDERRDEDKDLRHARCRARRVL
jgi:hypothetical protein